MLNIQSTRNRIKASLSNQDEFLNIWMLLFLIGISNNVYSIKLAAIFGLFIYLIFRFKNTLIQKLKNPKSILISLKNDKTFWFYSTLILIGIVHLALDFSSNYAIVVAVGIFIWLSNAILHGGVLFFTKTNSYLKTINTVRIFIVINFIFSLWDLAQVIWATKSLIPYAQIAPLPYGVASGDLIQGLFAPEHLPNGIIMTLLFFYFFLVKSYKTSFLALFTVLLESSNLSILIICFFLIFIFIITDKKAKYRALLFFTFILIFYLKINPINYYEVLKIVKASEENKYAEALVVEANSTQSEQERNWEELNQLRAQWELQFRDTIWERAADKQANNRANTELILKKKQNQRKEKNKILMDKHWIKMDSMNAQNKEKFRKVITKEFNLDETPGLLISLKQTANQLQESPKNLLIGSGIANSSSFLAITCTKLNESSRLFEMVLPEYEHPDFKNNNGALWKYVNYKGEEFHSIVHYPYNIYNTLLGEYGLIGFLAFILFYILPKALQLIKAKKIKMMLIIIPLFLVLVGTYYWFESFILILFFEIIIHNELKGNSKPTDLKSEE
jgi:hypothetical protein